MSGAFLSSSQLGRWAEELAHTYLCGQGLQCIERNYRCQQGEIDLIMQHEDILVFVEVRYRALPRYGDGLESISIHKQQRIVTTAEYYLSTHRPAQQYRCRFDVVAISGKLKNPQLRWISDAFRGE